MRWWGWGEDGHAVPLPPAAEELLRDELGADPELRRPPAAFDEVKLPDARLAGPVRERLVAALGAEQVRDDRETRIGHSVGRSYPDLVRIRSGDAAGAPDAVVLPGSAEQVAAVLALCAEQRVAVVPFGGGTSVVGGVEPVRDGLEAAISLDLRRLATTVEVDRTSLTARLDAGLLGPEAERRLGEEGVTLGHFPQSFEYSTVGGWVATRSAGQASTGYGRIDELVEAVRCVTPAGELGTKAVPASAAGPSIRELVVGSEGVFGVICEATVRVRPVPAARRYEGWSFASFAEGCDTFRVMEQAGAAADVNRLSDEDETRLTMALGSSGSTSERLGRRYLRMRGHEGGCMAILGFEGAEEDVEDRRRVAAALLRAGGGVAIGHRPGEA
jgi:alkyldihydroxyacetonephosphate synthase